VACIQLGRKYLGCELNKEFYEICKKRINQTSSYLDKLA